MSWLGGGAWEHIGSPCPVPVSNSLWHLSSHSPDVNYEELARCTDDFNGAQCKAVCVEAVSGGVRWVMGGGCFLPLPWRGQCYLASGLLRGRG